MIARRFDHLFDPFLVTNVAGVDAQAGRTRLSRFNPAFIVKMNVRNDGNGHLWHDLFKCF